MGAKESKLYVLEKADNDVAIDLNLVGTISN